MYKNLMPKYIPLSSRSCRQDTKYLSGKLHGCKKINMHTYQISTRLEDIIEIVSHILVASSEALMSLKISLYSHPVYQLRQATLRVHHPVPVHPLTTFCTFEDDVATLSSGNNPTMASNILQSQFGILES